MSRAIVCLVALMMAAPVWSQPPPRDTPAAAAHGTASIRGRVVDAATGRPLSRVEIRAGNGQGAAPSALTDAEGKYELSDLPAGTYAVSATKPNYVRTSWGEQRPDGPGKRITVVDGQRVTDIDMSLKRGGVVTGRIVDEFGDPVTDVFVAAMRYSYVQGSRRLMPSGHSGPTNDIGEYRLYGLSPGQYYISATLRSFSGPATDVSPDRSGYAPTFYPGTGNVAEAQRVSVAAGQTVPNMNLALLPIQTARVSGVALDIDGKVMVNGMVSVMQRTAGAPMFGSAVPLKADGTFVIPNLTPGDYTLRTQAPNGASASADIEVAGSDITDLVLTAVKPSTLRGRITFTESATSDVPPKAAAIDLGAVRDWALGAQVRSGAKISDDGSFEISLAAGRILLRAAPAPAGSLRPWRLSRVVFNGIDVGDSGIDVPVNGSVDNVVVEMTNHTGEATGRVTDADGNLVRDCFVIVFAQDPSRWTVQTRYLFASRPAFDDLYHARLLPGDYFAVAMSDVEAGAWTDPEFLSLARERATKFSIADGEQKSIDLRVVPAPQL